MGHSLQENESSNHIRHNLLEVMEVGFLAPTSNLDKLKAFQPRLHTPSPYRGQFC